MTTMTENITKDVCMAGHERALERNVGPAHADAVAVAVVHDSRSD